MIKQTVEERIASARLDLAINMPFYGSVFLRMKVLEDDTVPTAYTDGNVIGYNPDYLATLTHKQIIGAFVHEVLHVILKHHLRAAACLEYKLNHQLHNYACDYALNPIIKRSPGMDIKSTWLYEEKWDDELSDYIFEQLKRDAKQVEIAALGEDPGEVRPWPGEPGSKAPPTQAEVSQKEQEVEQWIRAAEFKAQGAGKMNDQTKVVIRGSVESTVSWVDELQIMSEDITRQDYTWTRPNVRYVQQGVYLPSMKGSKPVDMIFFVDVSGSLDTTQLKKIASEVQSIVGSFNIRVVVVYWSTEFKGMEMFDASDVLDPQFSLTATGRGGTNFSDCWTWMFDNEVEFDIDPKAIVFFSDLECSHYDPEDPGLPVLWAHIPESNGSFCSSYLNRLPDYGQLVRVPIYQGG